MIRCALIDDQPLIRSGLAMLINSQPDLTVVAEGSDGDEAAQIVARERPDLVLMDIRMKRVDGIEATRRILTAVPEDAAPRVIVLTTFDLDEYALDAIRAGASGFLLKDVPPEDLLAGIRTVHEGNAVISPTTTKRLLSHMAAARPASAPPPESAALLGRLSPRERDVFTLIAEGLTNREIMERLFVSEPTVKTHVSRILAKLEARDRVHLVVLAYQWGVVSP
ncbi:response regulator transcription factor [Falsarthrobacter nasiphocae]|uniref:DNA-binding NarL/FixJ family response regulator n=1 Tax=Falsarthrobacter nasiphocae TaxID=189863 RepID=A0AAE4C734_9MICC|nr:response regulator transcription factor [Falsarthrobacter nasiphocae]MDR6892822.1 DNA-binding NarL/FixJ family response regulator [Falsarthrobacter nasiphocae]